MTSSQPGTLTTLLYPAISLLVGLSGVLFFGWDWRSMIIFYWLSNITAAAVALVDIFRARIPNLKTVKLPHGGGKSSESPIRIATAVVFSIQYGVFTFMHGLFVFSLTNGEVFGMPDLGEPVDIVPIVTSWAILLVASVVMKLLRPGPVLGMKEAFMGPYKRILTLQMTIILGAFLITTFQLPAMAAILLIVLNAYFDVKWARKAQT